MKTDKKIGWQKYEEAIKEQINSPLLKELLSDLISQEMNFEKEDSSDESYDEEKMENFSGRNEMSLIPISENIVNEASLASSFDCWIGHTNFNITADIKNRVAKVDGVEILKVQSRYRFFVGIGRMFEFSKVREDIEKAIS